jgi:hypothetical protein
MLLKGPKLVSVLPTPEVLSGMLGGVPAESRATQWRALDEEVFTFLKL